MFYFTPLRKNRPGNKITQRGDWNQANQRKKHHFIPYLKYPAWHVCAGSALVSRSSSDIKGPRGSSWDVCLPPSLQATPPKRTIAILTIPGVTLSLIAPHYSFPEFRPQCPWQQHTHTHTHVHEYKAGARRKGNILMFESNSRCARGQGLNMKVPVCGVRQRRTGFQWEHSSLEGKGSDKHRFFYSFRPSLRYEALFCGGEFWQHQCERFASAPQATCQLSVIAGEKQVGMSFSGQGHRSDLTFCRKYLWFSSWLDESHFASQAWLEQRLRKKGIETVSNQGEWMVWLIVLGYAAAFPPPASYRAPIETSPVTCESLLHRFKNVSEKLG